MLRVPLLLRDRRLEERRSGEMLRLSRRVRLTGVRLRDRERREDPVDDMDRL